MYIAYNNIFIIYFFYFVDTAQSSVDSTQKAAQSAYETGKSYALGAKGKKINSFYFVTLHFTFYFFLFFIIFEDTATNTIQNTVDTIQKTRQSAFSAGNDYVASIIGRRRNSVYYLFVKK